MRFDPARLSFAELARAAREGGEIPVVYALDPAQEAASRPLFGAGVRARGEAPIAWVEDQEYYLRSSGFGRLPLLELQATRMNAEPDDLSRTRHLSPRQRQLLARMEAWAAEAWPDRGGADFASSWRQIEARLAELESRADGVPGS
ncbi:MAG: hypothetical protein ISR76_00525 [Planctomycetes bacterium]|nr:hypothetical protein [Planctomycetota bacterium]